MLDESVHGVPTHPSSDFPYYPRVVIVHSRVGGSFALLQGDSYEADDCRTEENEYPDGIEAPPGRGSDDDPEANKRGEGCCVPGLQHRGIRSRVSHRPRM